MSTLLVFLTATAVEGMMSTSGYCFAMRDSVLLEFKEAVSGGTLHGRGRIHSCICNSKTFDMDKKDAK
jgi:hypothetical protein